MYISYDIISISSYQFFSLVGHSDLDGNSTGHGGAGHDDERDQAEIYAVTSRWVPLLIILVAGILLSGTSEKVLHYCLSRLATMAAAGRGDQGAGQGQGQGQGPAAAAAALSNSSQLLRWAARALEYVGVVGGGGGGQVHQQPSSDNEQQQQQPQAAHGRRFAEEAQQQAGRKEILAAREACLRQVHHGRLSKFGEAAEAEDDPSGIHLILQSNSLPMYFMHIARLYLILRLLYVCISAAWAATAIAAREAKAIEDATRQLTGSHQKGGSGGSSGRGGRGGRGGGGGAGSDGLFADLLLSAPRMSSSTSMGGGGGVAGRSNLDAEPLHGDGEVAVR